MPNEFRKDSVLISDADIADMLGMSRSWVRKERLNRRRSLPHTLAIDPVMIGSTPRYRQSEVMDWVASLKNETSGSTVAHPPLPGCSHAAEGEV